MNQRIETAADGGAPPGIGVDPPTASCPGRPTAGVHRHAVRSAGTVIRAAAGRPARTIAPAGSPAAAHVRLPHRATALEATP